MFWKKTLSQESGDLNSSPGNLNNSSNLLVVHFLLGLISPVSFQLWNSGDLNDFHIICLYIRPVLFFLNSH